jgi:hypothetical protein
MKTTTFLVLLFTTSFFGTVSVAKGKPLSYVGGTMVMQENDETGTRFPSTTHLIRISRWGFIRNTRLTRTNFGWRGRS